ncbi:MAG: alginate lyase family protein [Betaproteobacteria bacterium]
MSRAAERARWYINRLSCMTPPEICHRAVRAVTARAERWGLSAIPVAPQPDLSHSGRAWFHVPLDPGSASCVVAADRIAAGDFDIFALKGVTLGCPPRWNRDPRTGVVAPLRFGKLLDYRDERLVGDIKYLWEPNRHLHIVTLAQACAISGAERYFHVLRVHLESWFDACPYGMGPNWSSALEAGIRLISWSTAWQILGGAQSRFFRTAVGASLRKRWVKSVYQHAEFIYGHFSRYSSANNHLIGEAAGLFVAALTWPCWARAHDWRAAAREILERETLLQNSADGVNLEQAVSYQRFDLELLLLCRLAAEANGAPFAQAYGARLESMLEYLASIMDAGGHVPMIGDSDDAVILRLDHNPALCPYRSLLAIGALIFHRADFAEKARSPDGNARWLVPDADAAFRNLDRSAATLPVKQAFPEGGYYVLGCDFETDQEVRLVVDAGPLGYQTIAAHGHADALAFTLSVGGAEFFIDPGTYAYHTREEWRHYFRGTSAHNTVRVDGMDQSRSGGKFMWVQKARALCSHWSSTAEQDIFEARHDGYLRLPDPVLHRRRITLDKQARRFMIEDSLEMRGTHTIELYFHCSEQCRIEEAPQGYAIGHGSRRILLALPQQPQGQRSIRRGSVAPILGWISRRFDEKHPSPTIAWRSRITGSAVLRSEISC